MNDALDALRSQRDDLSSRLSDVMAARERLANAESEEATILREIGELGASEIAALRDWARSGDGPKPEPDVEARRALHDKLLSAQAAAAIAKGASVDIEVELRDISNELRAINARIDDVALTTLQDEHREAVTELQQWIEASVRPRIAFVLGLRALVTRQAQEHQGSGRGDQAMALFRIGEAIGNAIPAIDFEPSLADVLNAASQWQGRLAELQTGEVRPEPPAPAILTFPKGAAAA